MKKCILLLLVIISPFYVKAQVKLSSTDVIWEDNNYSAFTSLVSYKGAFYCAFREASAHRPIATDVKTFGTITILKSKNARSWKLFRQVTEVNCDLRDPKLIVSNDDELLLLYCSRKVDNEVLGPPMSKILNLSDRDNLVAEEVSVQGYNKKRQWLWSVVNHNNVYYGFMYGNDFMFIKSLDGVKYDIISKMKPFGENPTEATLVFKDSIAYAVARSLNNDGLYGESVYPYSEWSWKKMNVKLGGPALVLLPNGKLILGTRNYQNEMGKTSLYLVNEGNAKKIVTLPSSSDSSYPSFVITAKNRLYVSYYSAVSGVSNIYLSKLVIE